jgi:hypothetical protein
MKALQRKHAETGARVDLRQFQKLVSVTLRARD